jgi:hypothetical protein
VTAKGPRIYERRRGCTRPVSGGHHSHGHRPSPAAIWAGAVHSGDGGPIVATVLELETPRLKPARTGSAAVGHPLSSFLARTVVRAIDQDKVVPWHFRSSFTGG